MQAVKTGEAERTHVFGQSGDVQDLYHAYELDVDAILNAAARLCVDAGMS